MLQNNTEYISTVNYGGWRLTAESLKSFLPLWLWESDITNIDTGNMKCIRYSLGASLPTCATYGSYEEPYGDKRNLQGSVSRQTLISGKLREPVALEDWWCARRLETWPKPRLDAILNRLPLNWESVISFTWLARRPCVPRPATPVTAWPRR